MRRIKYKIALFVFLAACVVFLRILFLNIGDIAVLHPKGWVGDKQRDLIVTATLLMLIVVIPVFFITFYFAWKYSAHHKEGKYTPDWADHPIAEMIWWGVPCVIVAILAVLTWKSSHELDPFKPLDVEKKPITIQVVALQWKWLFIYPEHNIATVNFFQFPEQTPVNFLITSDAPMNSFWIPQLGGQIYAMPGMQSKLHLIASAPGSFPGSSANLSGKGFSGMRFIAKASTEADFEQWVQDVKASQNRLAIEGYRQLAQPSENNPVATYVLEKSDLFDWILMKFNMPNMEK